MTELLTGTVVLLALLLALWVMDLGAYYSHQKRLKERARDLRTIFTPAEFYSVVVEIAALGEKLSLK